MIVLTLLVGSQTYNGAGMDFIARCMEDSDYITEKIMYSKFKKNYINRKTI